MTVTHASMSARRSASDSRTRCRLRGQRCLAYDDAFAATSIYHSERRRHDANDGQPRFRLVSIEGARVAELRERSEMTHDCALALRGLRAARCSLYPRPVSVRRN